MLQGQTTPAIKKMKSHHSQNYGWVQRRYYASEINQTEKDKYHMILLTRGI